jgi:hypothetical protein
MAADDRPFPRLRRLLRGSTAMLALSIALVPAALMTARAGYADDVPPATRFAVGSPAMLLAQSIARDHWGVDACGGQVQLAWGSDDRTVNARSYWANPVSAYGNPDLNVQCRIVFNADMAYSWPKFCTVVVHELGHLTGHEHTADGPDVMSPIYRAPLPACVSGDPTAPAPAVAPAPSAPVGITTVTDTPAASVVKRTRKARAKARAERLRARAASAPLRYYTDPADEQPWFGPTTLGAHHHH